MKRNTWRTSFCRSEVAPRLAAWLSEEASLTARCQMSCRDFRIRVLFSGRGRALADEGLLPASAAQEAWVREVVLLCDGVPVIFAHTTLSPATHGRLRRWLGRLGNRSLGSLLFRHPGFKRQAIEFLRLGPRHPLYQRAESLVAVRCPLWARRSVHRLGREQVVVTEVFLPALGAAI